MKTKLLVFLFQFFFSLVSLFAQPSTTSESTDLAKAFGYAYGVDLSLEKIKNSYPSLSKGAMFCQSKFKTYHGKTFEYIEGELINEFGHSGLNQLKNNMLVEYQKALRNNPISVSDAQYYLNNFDSERIFGNNSINREFVSILLRFNPLYKEAPAKEFVDGFTQKFTTKGHPKSKGLNISIEYPTSWILKEGKRPNIIKLFRQADNHSSFSIIIKDFITEMPSDLGPLSEEDKAYFKSDAFAEEMTEEIYDEAYGMELLTGAGFENISDFNFKKTKIEGQPAIIVQGRGKLSRGAFEMEAFIKYYLVSWRNYLITIGAFINPVQGEIEPNRQKYELLVDLIVNSLIIEDKW